MGVSNPMPYAGKKDTGDFDVIMKLLMLDLEMRGYHLFIDNYFTKLKLLFELQEIGFAITGTIRQSRKGLLITVILMKQQRMVEDESEYYMCTNPCVDFFKDYYL